MIKWKSASIAGIILSGLIAGQTDYAGANFSSDTGGADMTVTATSIAFQGDFSAALVFSIR